VIALVLVTELAEGIELVSLAREQGRSQPLLDVFFSSQDPARRIAAFEVSATDLRYLRRLSLVVVQRRQGALVAGCVEQGQGDTPQQEQQRRDDGRRLQPAFGQPLAQPAPLWLDLLLE